MKRKLVAGDCVVRSIVFAPFFSYEASTNRPRLVSEVLEQFGPVDIVTTRFDHQTKREKTLFQFGDQRKIYYLPTIPYYRNVSPIRFFSHFVFSLRAWFFFLRRMGEYDLIYVTLPLNLLALLVFLTGRKKLRVADVVDIWPDVLPFPSLAKRVFRPFFALWKWSFALAVNHCDALLTVSDKFMDESIMFFRGKNDAAVRIYIGAKRLPHKAARLAGRLTIAYIGNIGHLYDFETLLTAMQAFQDEVQFFVIGDGDRKDWLLGELNRRNLMHCYFGVVYDDEKLAEILARCEWGFNGYKNTSAAFSYKANTYFSAGLPILNSMSGDLRDLVAEHGLGFNYTSGDVESLRCGIKDCLSRGGTSMSRSVDHFFELEIEQKAIQEKMTKFIDGLLQNRATL